MEAQLDENIYRKGRKVSKRQFKELELPAHDVHYGTTPFLPAAIADFLNLSLLSISSWTSTLVTVGLWPLSRDEPTSKCLLQPGSRRRLSRLAHESQDHFRLQSTLPSSQTSSSRSDRPTMRAAR